MIKHLGYFITILTVVALTPIILLLAFVTAIKNQYYKDLFIL
jgi:hypothetical protein